MLLTGLRLLTGDGRISKEDLTMSIALSSPGLGILPAHLRLFACSIVESQVGLLKMCGVGLKRSLTLRHTCTKVTVLLFSVAL